MEVLFCCCCFCLLSGSHHLVLAVLYTNFLGLSKYVGYVHNFYSIFNDTSEKDLSRFQGIRLFALLSKTILKAADSHSLRLLSQKC